MSKIFVGGITAQTTDEMMIDSFSVYGTVTDAKVMRDRDTFKSRGFGFVTFADNSAAQSCVSSIVTCDGRNVDCKLAQSKEEIEAQPYRPSSIQQPLEPMKPALGAITSGKVFVGGLSQATNQDSLLAAMQPYGEISEVMVMFDKVTEKSRGFGFVTFVEPSSVSSLIQTPNLEVDGKLVEIKPAQEKSSNAPGQGNGGRTQPGSLKIFVGGLAGATTDQTLQAYFSTFGQLAEVSIMYDKETGKSRGFGFVEYHHFDAVSSVLAQNNHHVDGKWVDCKAAVPENTGPLRPGAGGKGTFGGKGFGKGGKQAFGFAPYHHRANGHQGGYQHRAQPY